MTEQPSVYFITDGEHVKIGVAKDPAARLTALQVGHPSRLTLLGIAPGGEQCEQYLQSMFKAEHHRGEWYALSARLKEFIVYFTRPLRGEHSARRSTARLNRYTPGDAGELRNLRDAAICSGTFLHYVRWHLVHILRTETDLRPHEIVDLKVRNFCGTHFQDVGKSGRTVFLSNRAADAVSDYLGIKARVLIEPAGPDDYLLLSERKRPYTTRGISKAMTGLLEVA